MGSAAASPLSGRPALPPLPGAGRGLGKFVFVAGKAPDGRRGRALRFFPFAFGKRPGQQARRGGAARRPAPGARGPQEGGGRWAGGGREGRTHARRWECAAGAESGAGARPRRRSADSGAAGAGGGGEAAGKEAAAERRSRRASMGRPAPRPLLLALLWLGECARVSEGRGGTCGPQGGGWGDSWGAAVARGLGRPGCRGRSRETRRDTRAALPGGEPRGAPRARREPAPATRGMSIPALLGRASPPTRARGVARDRLPQALPTCWPLGARLTLNSRAGRCLRSLAGIPSSRAEIGAFDLPRHRRDRLTRSSHATPG